MALSSSRWFCLIPIGFPIPVLRRCFRLGREKSVTIRHLDFQQSLGVEDVTLFDDVVLVEQKSSHGVNLVGSERSLRVPWHGAVDIVPHRRRERPIAPKSQYWSASGELSRRRLPNAGPDLRSRFARGKRTFSCVDLRSLFGRSSSRRELFSICADDVIPGAQFRFRRRPAHFIGRRLRHGQRRTPAGPSRGT